MIGLVKKYKTEIDLKIILQIENIEISTLKELLYKLLDMIFDIKNDDYLEEEENKDSLNDSEELSDYDNNSNISNNDEEEDNLPNVSNMNDDFIIDKMEEKLEIMTDEYYIKNKKDNLFKDKINLSKKRKYESFENKFIKEINDIPYEDINNKNDKKNKRKKH